MQQVPSNSRAKGACYGAIFLAVLWAGLGLGGVAWAGREADKGGDADVAADAAAMPVSDVPVSDRASPELPRGIMPVPAPPQTLGQNPGQSLLFPISGYTVTGNTLLPQASIAAALHPFTGAQKAFADINAAAAALKQLYSQHGYETIQVVIPQQTLEQDVVVLQVQEAVASPVHYQTTPFHDAKNLQRSLPALQEGLTPNVKAMTTEMEIANENPAKQTDVVFAPAADGAAVAADVKITDSNPWKFTFNGDNTGDHNTGMFRTGVAAQYANLFNRDQVLTAQYITSPDHINAVTIFGLGYRIPLYDLHGVVDFVAGYSEVSDGQVSDLFDISGKGTVLGVKYSQYLQRTAQLTQKIIFGLDYRAYQNAVLVEGSTQSLVPSITIHPASLGYSGDWQRGKYSVSFSLSGYQNIPGGANGDQTTFQQTRSGSVADYTFFSGGFDARYFVFDDWQLRAVTHGQFSTEPLIPEEQFGVGGSQSVRGLYERAVLGDSGYFANIELYAPDIAPWLKWQNIQMRPLLFYDQGMAFRNQALAGEAQTETDSSIGAGIRFSYRQNINLRIDAADAFIRQPSSLATKPVQATLEISY